MEIFKPEKTEIGTLTELYAIANVTDDDVADTVKEWESYPPVEGYEKLLDAEVKE